MLVMIGKFRSVGGLVFVFDFLWWIICFCFVCTCKASGNSYNEQNVERCNLKLYASVSNNNLFLVFFAAVNSIDRLTDRGFQHFKFVA